MAVSPEKKPCFFCHQKRKSSKEHAIPAWVYEATRQVIPDAQFEAQLAGDEPFRGPIRINKICKPCNEGWISDLEALAGPIIAPAILGYFPLRFGRREQKIVSAWITKTTMVFEHIGRHEKLKTSYFRPNQCDRVRLRQEPIDNCVIWLAGYEGKRFALHKSVTLALAPKPPSFGHGEGYCASLIIGKFCFQFFTTGRKPSDPTRKEAEIHIFTPPMWKHSTVVIWPPSLAPEVITWPPTIILGDDVFDAFAYRVRDVRNGPTDGTTLLFDMT